MFWIYFQHLLLCFAIVLMGLYHCNLKTFYVTLAFRALSVCSILVLGRGTGFSSVLVLGAGIGLKSSLNCIGGGIIFSSNVSVNFLTFLAWFLNGLIHEFHRWLYGIGCGFLLSTIITLTVFLALSFNKKLINWRFDSFSRSDLFI